jgi:hypothetical protein
MSYEVDIALCIDCTGSMGNAIARVKAHALRFHADLVEGMKYKRKELTRLRLRVIGFRDYYDAAAPAMIESGFFELPGQAGELQDFVSKLEAKGGGDPPESALEALALAIGSPWNFSNQKQRHVVTLWTDEASHPFEKLANSKAVHAYPKERVAASLDELTDWWDDSSKIGKYARRLVLFAPKLYPWGEIYDSWDEVTWYPSVAGKGLSNDDYTQIMMQLVNSIAGGVEQRALNQ